jgi:arylsulfatase A-like enzyme
VGAVGACDGTYCEDVSAATFLNELRGRLLNRCSTTFLKLMWGTYLVLTSLYCLLAYLPYTFYALIKAPPYEWMPWFVNHHVPLFLLVAAVAAKAYWPHDYWPNAKDRGYIVLLTALAGGGFYLAVHPFLGTLGNNFAAYKWSLISLLPLAATSLTDIIWCYQTSRRDDSSGLLDYPTGIVVAVSVALLYVGGGQLRTYLETHSYKFRSADVQLTGWSVLSHVLVIVVALSALNLIAIAANKTPWPTIVRRVLTILTVFAVLWAAFARLEEHALSFEGNPALLYAACLAATLTLFGLSVALPWMERSYIGRMTVGRQIKQKVILSGIALVLAAAAVLLPTLIGANDWNGLFQRSFVLALWVAVSICAYKIRKSDVDYSFATVAVVLLLAVVSYKGLQFSEILWAKPLGATDDDISRAMEKYAAHDASFQLAHHLLGNDTRERCDDLCHILREYTNIRDTQARTDVNLVEHLTPARGVRPHIFIFVIDSLRPDYLGAYNSSVDFTPNLDAFAKDSIVVHNAYTQYAGTTLSEPAIWSGAMLLHTHYLQPFSKVNTLEKLARADGYKMVVSYDTVLSQLLQPSDDIIKLDTNKTLWTQFELCSTVDQTEIALDKLDVRTQPIFFYAQPMNVHQFAQNHMPSGAEDHWRTRHGFNNRAAHEVSQVDGCMGSFFRYLKARGMYDDSIIIVASDHGDATGELGRFSHSLYLYPEVMRVPLLVHLPARMRERVVYDDSRISALTDISPSLYYLLGHRPIKRDAMFGKPIFMQSREELDAFARDELFFASDVRAAYGILADNGRYFYATYDSPPESYLYDLGADPEGQRNVLTPTLKRQYDERIIEQLRAIADFYRYKPGMNSLLMAQR